MKLYHTNLEKGLILADPEHGVGEWIEFTDQPLAGFGDTVYIIELPEAKAKQFEFTDSEPNLLKGVRYFDIPARDLHNVHVRVDSYRRMTGKMWNQWQIVLKEAKPDPAHTTTKVWASRAGVCELRWLDNKKGDQIVQVTLTEEFNLDEDYLVLETQHFFGRQWNLEVLAGTPPDWVEFPVAWSEWVQREDVQKSAVDYLKATFPNAVLAIQLAEGETEKVNKIRAWRIVAEKVSTELGRDIGKINAGSRTSTLAMPLRIAERAGGWNPPIPRPEFVDANASGRICLASATEDEPEEIKEVYGTNFISRRYAQDRPQRARAGKHV
jgi:hypothetical protein